MMYDIYDIIALKLSWSILWGTWTSVLYIYKTLNLLVKLNKHAHKILKYSGNQIE